MARRRQIDVAEAPPPKRRSRKAAGTGGSEPTAAPDRSARNESSSAGKPVRIKADTKLPRGKKAAGAGRSEPAAGPARSAAPVLDFPNKNPLADKSDRIKQRGKRTAAGTRRPELGDSFSGSANPALDFLNENPFAEELGQISRHNTRLRRGKREATGRPDPLLDLNLLADPGESLHRGLAVIWSSLRELLSGETARLVDTSETIELDALWKQLEARRSVLEATLKGVNDQLRRLNERRQHLREPQSLHASTQS
jgi:hypothetical protein